MRAKVLPLGAMGIRAWPEQNFLFEILMSMQEGEKWIYNHFIQLRGTHYINRAWNKTDSSVTFYPYAIHYLAPNMFDLCPFIDKYVLPRSFVFGLFSKFHSFVISAIEEGFYISTFLDQFFRDDMHGNHGYHHPTFIYGYDDAAKCVYITDNFENGKYAKKQISYDQLDTAFSLITGQEWCYGVILYGAKEKAYDFVPGYVKEQLQDYLEPKRGICYMDRTLCPDPFHDGEDYLNEVFFGAQCYDLIDRSMQAILEYDDEYSAHDWRSLVQMCDHKYLMRKRYQYMVQHGYAAMDDTLHEELETLEEERRRQKKPGAFGRGTASNEMCTFLVVNISSLQLIPINMIAYRSQYGSTHPLAVAGPAFLATCISTLAGVAVCRVMCRRKQYKSIKKDGWK